ncbi:PorT family protein [Fulvivirga ulvae]|uniref:outer membrane beta-barrel protein n=1 Tax=Fulvivirga ulvae TaxID=2904245 RepID=UPI001F403E6C|nr:outer membrane beta-barrel protein [Fulvivirga ulvae]UII29660.1 PorT family protein [Fulvivirga ulvae]
MDDNKFDKKIREKVENFRDEQYDEHARMAGVSYQPWYAPYKKAAGYAAAIVLISLLNFGLFAYFHGQRDHELMASIEEMKEDMGNYEKLKRDYETLRLTRAETVTEFKTDTVYVYKEFVGSAGHGQTSYGGLRALSTAYHKPTEGGQYYTQREDVRLGKVDEISTEVKDFLAQYNLAYIGEDEHVYLQYHNQEYAQFVTRKGYDAPAVFNGSDIELASVEITEPEHKTLDKHKKQQLSVKVLRDIEKQRMKGIGFQYGPEVDLLKLSTDRGSGHPGLAAGIKAEFILSPSLRVETGAKYSYTGYTVNNPDQLGDELATYPGQNEDIGRLQQIEQRTHAISVPLQLKYYYPVARDRYIFASIGASPQMHLLQQFEYEYEYNYSSQENDFSVDIEASKHFDDGKIYTGTMDFSLGIEKKLKNHSILQLSGFYSRGIGKLGMEKSELALVGVRTALKFRVN